MLRVLSDGRNRGSWDGWRWALVLMFALWIGTVITYWIVTR